jgi:neutral ceramidase
MTCRQLTTVVLWLIIASRAAAAQDLQAGAAKTDITPPIGYSMWGYGARHDGPSTGILDHLHARALVLGVGDERIALVSLDLGRAPTRQSMAAIRARVKAAAGIEHLFVVGSHTHHGPVIELRNWPDPKNPYVVQLEQKLADVILEAARTMVPARLGVASKQVPYNRNRHSKLPEKPVDHELLVLRVETTNGKAIAHAVNFAAHPTMHSAQVFKFSADYPGALAEVVEKESGAPCLFLQGAAGDLSPNPGENHGPEKFGQALGKEVLALAKTIQCTDAAQHSLQVREDDFQFKSRTDFSSLLIKAMFVQAFFKDLVDFYIAEYRDGIRPHLTTALLDGKIGLVGVSGEFFCGHSLNLKRRARLDHLFFMGYCNDYHQYFPTIQGAAEGGYGADPQVSPVEVGAGERMMDRALIHLYKMRGKLPDLNPTK